MRLSARLLFIFIFSFLFFLFSTPFAHAQTSPYINPSTDANVPANLHTYTQSMMLDIMSSFACDLTGTDPVTATHQCLGYDSKTGLIGYVQSNGGALGFMTTMVATLYTPPVQTSTYVRYVADNFGLTKHAYAASTNGVGFDKLSPLIGLWSTVRDVTYLGFVLVFIIIGFAIMLRYKIDPRTVMTIENQIPKIVIALIMVTFSYAIAGFMVDMMYVTTYVGINVVTSAPGISKDTVSSIHGAELNDLNGGNPFSFMNDTVKFLDITSGASGSIKDIVQNLFNNPIQEIPTNQGVQGWVGAIFSQTIGNGVGWLLGIIAGLAAFLIIAIAILWSMFRVWFSLLGAYVSILLNVILAPFTIMVGLLPGSKVGFGSWARDLAANLLAFPVTAFMFILAKVFMDSFTSNANGIFVPPLIGNPQPGGGSASPVGYLIALGFILMTPTVTNMTRGFLKVEQNKNMQSIFQALGKGAGTMGKITGGFTNAAFGASVHWDASKGTYVNDKPLMKLAKAFGMIR